VGQLPIHLFTYLPICPILAHLAQSCWDWVGRRGVNLRLRASKAERVAHISS